MTDWRELGTICRVQIQRSSLKIGPPKGRYFDPSPLLETTAIAVTADGVTLRAGDETTLDVHNARHPESKNLNGVNDISIGFTGHYDLIRARFGGQITNGIAGENILVERAEQVTLDEIGGGLLIVTADGRRIELGGVRVAHPCVEFSRFVMGDPLAPSLAVSETLKFLDGGVRGFYVGVNDGVDAWVTPGDQLFGRAGGD